MRNASLILLIVVLLPTAAVARESGCVTCHADEEMEEAARKPALVFAGDAHDKAGMTCASCHGGNPDSKDFLVAHRKSDGFRSRPKEAEIVKLCSDCHGDAGRMKEFGVEEPDLSPVEQFHESVHGRINPVEGFEIPTCASCHGAHGIRPPTDPLSSVHATRIPAVCARCHQDLAYMRAFTSARIRVDQLLEYRTSVHGKRLEAGDTQVAVCSSCHGSHDILPADNPGSRVHPLRVEETCGKCHANPEHMRSYSLVDKSGNKAPIPTDQLSRYRRSVHRAALVEKGDLSAPTCNDCHGNHGATPPEVRVVANVCAQCHSRPAELYETSELKTQLEAAGMPHCATCHGHHDVVHPGDDLLVSLSRGVTPSGWEPGARWRRMAEEFRSSIRGFETRLRAAEELVVRVENLGMDLTRARLRLSQAKDSLIRSRVVLHTGEVARLREVIDGTEDEAGGLTLVAEVETLAADALRERRFRRYGLVGALLVIVFLMVTLILKIRQMESAAI